MADGKTHHKTTKTLIKASLAPSVLLSLSLAWWLMFIPLGVWVGLFVTPDLDHHHLTTYNESIIIRWNSTIGNAFVAFWKPYGVLYGHRSSWSHSPIVSTFIRFAYMTPAIAIIWLPVMYLSFPSTWAILPFIAIFIGMCIADMGHLWKDGIIQDIPCIVGRSVVKCIQWLHSSIGRANDS